MLMTLIDQTLRLVYPPKIPGGGTFGRTKSGELRWSFRFYGSSEDIQKHDAYRRKLMAHEPWFRFAPYARDLRVLPESATYGGPDWTKKLSEGAERYLAELDDLHARRPRAAIKIAAIVVATTSMHYVLAKEAGRRVCTWLLEDDVPSRTRIELGISIRETWPDKYNKVEGLEHALLELIVQESEVDPKYILRMIQPLRAKSGNAGWVFTSQEDPELLLVLGRNLKPLAPAFCKSVLSNYLFLGRHPVFSFSPPSDALRRVADELLALETATPYANNQQAGSVYYQLGQWGHPDAGWYASVLERLFAAAERSEQPMQAVGWFRAVAINAVPGSALHSRAMTRFSTWADGYRELALETDRALQEHARKLLETVSVARSEKVIQGRNVDLPANPGHPIVEVAVRAYWGLVDWLAAQHSAWCLPVLALGIERDEAGLAEQAVERLAEVFEAMARRDSKTAEATLVRLARNTFYSDADANRKTRCVGLFHRLLPVLQTIDPEAAARAKKDGFHNPTWDIF
ncbi:MAG: hypothetical protein FJ209_04945 [Betaproteobacteria bacterium]|nr:hypothetical protein [Betaproteobacteria bacterium]